MGKGRRIQPGQKIHASVAFSNDKYFPKAVLPKHVGPKNGWNSLMDARTDDNEKFTCPDEWKPWLDMDMFDASAAGTVVENLENSSIHPMLSVYRLTMLTRSGV